MTNETQVVTEEHVGEPAIEKQPFSLLVWMSSRGIFVFTAVLVVIAAVFIARQQVPMVTHPAQRIAPMSVRLSPQFMGRGSTYSSPRLTHACDRPIAIFTPASSIATSRCGSIAWICRRNRRRRR